MKRLLALIALLAGAISLAACTPATADHRPVALVYGDSLTVLSEQVAIQDFPAWHLVFRAQGGTAPCDWAAHAASDRIAYKPFRVVLAFTGNTDACVAGGVPGHPDPISLPGFLVNYDKYMQMFRMAFAGIPVSVLAPPAMHDNIGWFPYNGNPALLTQYQAEADQWGWTYNSSADVQLTPGHVFTYTRPAYPGNGPLVAVRTPDGVHLTPAGELYYGRDLLR